METFWNLASLDQETRLKATKELLQNTKTSQEIEYNLTRLFKGLSSSRDAARQGFALSLSQVLSLHPIPVSTCLENIMKYCPVSKGTKNSILKDSLFGRVFGFLAVLKSGLLNTASLEEYMQIMTLLLEITQFKSYLFEACFSIIIEMCKTCRKDIQSELLESVWKLIVTDASVDNIHVGIELNNLGYIGSLTGFVGPLFSLENINLFKSLLVESTSVHPNIHSIWHVLIQSCRQETTNISINEFWVHFVEGLFN